MSESTQRPATTRGGEPDAEVSDLSTAAAMVQAKEQAREKRRVSWLKRGRAVVGGLILLTTFGLGGFFWLFPATSVAHTVGLAVTVSARIAGVVMQLDRDVGDVVEAGEVLAYIVNERVDLGRLQALYMQRTAAEARLAAIRAEIGNKTRARDRQRSQLASQRSYQVEGVDQRLQEARALLASATASLARKESQFRALTSLYEQQLAARLDKEAAENEWMAASKAADAQAAVVARLESNARALRAGFFIEVEAPFQQPRLEELAIRMSDLEVLAGELVSNIGDLRRAISTEEQQVARLTKAVVVSPVRGRVWRRSVTNGQYVAPGSELLEVVDLSSIRVEAYFHQRYLPDMAVGDPALVSPVGSRDRLRGTVRLVGADASAQAPTVAPQWDPKQDKPMRVVISLSEADRRRLWVGQRVTVAIGPSPSSPSRLAHLYVAVATLLPTW